MIPQFEKTYASILQTMEPYPDTIRIMLMGTYLATLGHDIVREKNVDEDYIIRLSVIREDIVERLGLTEE